MWAAALRMWVMGTGSKNEQKNDGTDRDRK